MWQRAVKHVHESGQFTPEMLSSPACLSVIRETYRILMRGVSRGLSTEVPAGLSESLAENVFVFSGFKTFHEMREVSHMLRDPETGGLKPFHQFEQDVRKINETYNHHYLRAEYHFAESSAHMTERWKTFERDNGPDVMLQYRTANDERVRDEHRNLHNVTLPMDDPFWNSYLPPLGWNCRCTTVMVRASKFPKSNSEEACRMGEAATDGPKKSIFRFNPGKTEKIFPPKHPYLPKGCGNCDKNLRLAYNANSESCRACKAIDNCIKTHDVVNVEQLSTYPNGGSVNVYRMITDRDSDDYKRIRQTAEFFASKGETVTITPRFHSAERCDDYYKVYAGINNRYIGKCPDLKVGEAYYEHEGFSSNKPKKALKNMLSHGLTQSDKIVIEQPDLTDKYILDRIADKVKEGVMVSEVWLKNGDRLRLLYKKSTS